MSTISNPRQYRTRVKVSRLSFTALIALGRSVTAALLANIADFATPTPLLATLNTAIDDVDTALATYGHKRNKGSKAERLDLENKAQHLRDLLIAEQDYVMNTVLLAGLDTSAQAALMAKSGFGLRSPNKRTNFKAQVPRLRFQLNTAQFNPSDRTIKVKKPKGLFRGKKSAGYNVYNAATGAIIGTFTATRFQVPVGVNEIHIAAITENGAGHKVYMKLLS